MERRRRRGDLGGELVEDAVEDEVIGRVIRRDAGVCMERVCQAMEVNGRGAGR